MALQFRRGKEAIAKANESSGSGSYTPYLPNFYWKDHQQSRLLWVLNPIDDIPLVKTIKVFTTDKRTEYVIARQDDAIGESSDPIEDEWGYGPAASNVCIAVELEAVMEVRRGRERPVSFAVATREFTRKERDVNGKETGRKETVTAPVVGVVVKSPSNFFNHLSSKDTTVGPIHQFPLQIVRNGDDENTDYDIEVFEDKELDIDGLILNWENISYLNAQEREELFDLTEKAEDDDEVSEIIGAFLLDKWLNEHADLKWYNEVLSKVSGKAKYPSKKYREANGMSAAKSEPAPHRERPSRPSQRRANENAEAESEDNHPEDAEPEQNVAAPEPEGEVIAEDRPKTKRARRNVPVATNDDDDKPVSKSSPIKERMEALRAETAKRSKEAA